MAEDAGIFGRKNMFHDYLAQFSAREMRQALIKLFKVLDTKFNRLQKYIGNVPPITANNS